MITTAVKTAATRVREFGRKREGKRSDAATDRRRESSAETRQQRHESYRLERVLANAGGSRFNHRKPLLTALAFLLACEWQHHPAARLQVANSRCGQVGRPGG